MLSFQSCQFENKPILVVHLCSKVFDTRPTQYLQKPLNMRAQ